MTRSSITPLEVSGAAVLKKIGVLKIQQISQGNTCYWSLFLIKLQASRLKLSFFCNNSYQLKLLVKVRSQILGQVLNMLLHSTNLWEIQVERIFGAFSEALLGHKRCSIKICALRVKLQLRIMFKIISMFF